MRGSVDLAAIQAAYEADPENVFLIKPNLAGTNWYDAITRVASVNRHSLGFSGGTENGRYYIGMGAQEQSGIFIANEFKRYSFRANSEWDLVKWLKPWSKSSVYLPVCNRSARWRWWYRRLLMMNLRSYLLIVCQPFFLYMMSLVVLPVPGPLALTIRVIRYED